MRTIQDIVESYDFETVSELAEYVVESFNNGQDQQALRIFIEAKSVYGADVELGRSIVEMVNPSLALDILRKVNFGWYGSVDYYNTTAIENLFYDQGLDIPSNI